MSQPAVGDQVRVIRDSTYSKVGWEGELVSYQNKRVIDVVWATGPHPGAHQTILVERVGPVPVAPWVAPA